MSRKNTNVPTEFQEACTFVDWLELMKNQGKVLDFCHIANESYGGTRADMLRGAKLKRQGRKRGVFDYEVFLPKTKTHPARELRIELKRSGGKASQEQLHWLQVYAECQIEAAICQGAEAAIALVKEFI